MSDWGRIDDDTPTDRLLLLWQDNRPVFGKWDDDRFSKKPRPFWSTDRTPVMGREWSRARPPTHWRYPPAGPGDATP